VQLTDEMRGKGIRLLTSVRASIFYMGFNMLDPVVGGLERAVRASCGRPVDRHRPGGVHLDLHERPRHRGEESAAAGHLRLSRRRGGHQPGGLRLGRWRPRRKPIAVAKKLLAEAGWPNGRNATTGEPLVLNLDTTGGGMGDKSRLDWLTRQFAKLDIQLVVRSTDFNRFQEKVRKGAVQLYLPRLERRLSRSGELLLPARRSEGKVAKGGENASNYANPEFDRLFAAR
jgi:oligopeptide transport system substrate-binding protein